MKPRKSLVPLAMALVVSSTGACGRRTVGASGEETSTPTTRAPRAVETFAAPLVLTAGDEVSVQCVVREGDAHVPGAPATVTVSSGAVVPALDGNGKLYLTESGPHLVKCGTADGEFSDPVGVTVTVRPAQGVVVDTYLPVTAALAGVPSPVECRVFDTYGNLLPDGAASGLVTDPTVLVEPTPTNIFNIRGTVAGERVIACDLDGVVDLSPETFEVLAGIPGATETTVSRASVPPTEWVDVGCSVTDAYGNPISGTSPSFYVMAADGVAAGAAGLLRDGMSFSATRAGTYYVFCNVPGNHAGDETPAEVKVTPGAAESMVVDLLDLDCYWQDRPLPLDVLVYDAWGNEIRVTDPDVDFTLELTSVPAGAVVADGQGGFVVVEEGDIDLALTGVGTGVGAGFQPHYFSIRVDSTPPVINIASPARASYVTAGGTTSHNVTITGEALDTVSHLTSLSINGLSVPVGTNQSVVPISRSMSSPWGTNVITGTAEDACGNRAVRAQSFIRSPVFAKPNSGTSSSSTCNTLSDGCAVRNGVVAQLNQSMIDDGDRTESNVDDMATLAERVLQGFDLDDMLPPGYDLSVDPLRSSGDCDFSFPCGDVWADYGWTLERDSNANRHINVDGPDVLDLDAINGGLRVTARLNNFDFPLRLSADDRVCTCGVTTSPVPALNISGWAGADQVVATGNLAVSYSGGAPQVTLPSLTLNTSGLYINLDCGVFDFVCDIATDLVVPFLAGLVEDALADIIADEIPFLLEGVLDSFVLDTGFALPAPFSMTLGMDSGIDPQSTTPTGSSTGIYFCGPQFAGMSKPSFCPSANPPLGQGFGVMPLFARVYPGSRGTGIPSGRGAPVRPATVPGLNSNGFSNTAYAFGMGLSDDLVNQILWALWYGGGLNLDFDDVAGLAGGFDLTGIELAMAALAPPVMQSDPFSNDFMLGLGDVFLVASVDLGALLGQDINPPAIIETQMYLTAFLDGNLSLNSSTNELTASLTDPTVYVEVVAIDDPAYQATLSELFANLLAYMLPQIMSSAVQSFPLPTFDLGGLGVPGLPAQSVVWELTGGSLKRETPRFTSDFYILSGSLR